MRILLVFVAVAAWAQLPTNPVVQPRGVVNAYTQAPAPSVAAPGGLIQIRGLNLGEPVEVLVNNRAAKVLSASAEQIVAQVPPELPNGLANVVVRKGGVNSRAARIQIANLAPGLAAENGQGFGAAAMERRDGKLVLRASGLGPVDEEGSLRLPPTLFADGVVQEAVIRPMADSPGVYEIEVPENRVSAGAPLLLTVNNVVANVLPAGPRPSRADLSYVPLPEGTPELRSLRSSDVRGQFLTAAGARGADGCYPTFLIDAVKKSVKATGACLTTAQVQAPTPFVESINDSAFAAFEGPYQAPPAGAAPSGVSSKLRIFRAEREALAVTLPETALQLNGGPAGNFVANTAAAAGQAPKVFDIDAESGEVRERAPAQNPAVNPGAAQNLANRFQNLDLGEGLNRLLTNVAVANNQLWLTVGDSLDNPKKAKVAVLNAQGEVLSQREFPEAWLPLTAPAAPQNPGNPGNPGNPAQPQLRLPTPSYYDGATRSYYVMAVNAQGRHGFAYFPAEGEARVIALSEEWTFTACVPNIPIYNLELARRIALLGSRTEDRSFKNPCPADGYLLFDLASRQFSPVALPGSGQLNASGGANELNDFLFGNNTDPARRNTADTLYVLDGVNETAYRFDLPAGVNNFSGGAVVQPLNLIVATGNNRVAGDAGLILFDLERAEAKLLPTPEGFAAVNLIGVLPGVRKLVARGVLSGNAGAQLLVYDLVSGDLEILANPEGVAWVGPVPAAPPTPGQPPQQQVNVPIRLNGKAHTVEALAYGEDRRPRGVIVVRIN